MARFGCWLRLQRALSAAVALLLCSCQTAMVPTNDPLPQNTQGMPVYSGGYALLPMLQHPQGEIVFIMAFSGGGKRSAAFAHGVLRGLRQIPVVEDGRTRSLLDELDYIAADVFASARIHLMEVDPVAPMAIDSKRWVAVGWVERAVPST